MFPNANVICTRFMHRSIGKQSERRQRPWP